MSEHAKSPDANTAEDARVRRVELLISALLRVGVAASLLLVAAGTVISFVHHPDYLSHSPALQRLTSPGGGGAVPRTLPDVLRGLREGRGQALVTVGLLLLIATPVLRVAVSILAFAYARDRRYVLITTIVLALLVLSFLLGKAER